MEKEILYTVIKEQKVSAPFLQREFNLTYFQASEVIKNFERLGIIGKKNGSKPRIINYKLNN
jgi:DNA segregation ATPase FtsK/SpoIIIE-like protein